MYDVTVILTCHNRCGKTVSCIRSLAQKNKAARLRFIVVDDNSTDKTLEALKELSDKGICIELIRGSGELYYSGGMRLGMEKAKKEAGFDHCLMVNDDVSFFDGCVDRMLEFHESFVKNGKETVIIGCTCSEGGELTYGGVKYTGRGVKYRQVGPGEDIDCDTFNANCVLIPKDVFENADIIDPVYVHSLGDFDYGLSLSRKGIHLRTFSGFAGSCEKNPDKNTWTDRSLGRRQRLKAKESIKGAPFKQWFYFLKKNFGYTEAFLHAFTPYIRIALNR